MPFKSEKQRRWMWANDPEMAEEWEEKEKSESRRMKITRNQLRKIIREAEGSTKKYDDDSALRGGQDKLPDKLQKGIIDKTVEDREAHEEEEREEKNESMKISHMTLRKIIREAIGSGDPAGNVIGYIDADIDGDYRYNQKLEVFYDSGSDVTTVVVKDSSAVGGMDYRGQGEGRSNYHISGTRVLPSGASGKDLIAAIKGMINRHGDTIKRYGRPTKNFSWGASKWDSQGLQGLNAKLANVALQKARSQERR